MSDTHATPYHLHTSIAAWQRGDLTRDDLVRTLIRLSPEDGQLVHDVIHDLCAGRPGGGPPQGASADDWRAELMASRARTWRVPAVAGLLVGPEVLVLTDGREGVVLRDTGTQCLPASVCASMMLLCETIVMAHTALDQQELQKLQQQRVDATSTSLSEIDRIP
ncbi:hypothetical protein HNQ07_000973 [Deinococcus metalli]|uniref:Uncharacterized protein n=1 Tax=Deinococcus metalli TaxID=1141878 RepID=A0A7W8NM86_9DEIO|nr:hypothetical protein [Deinococcus metalli]MBB5375529.1 hypothetical protein [Deinococcus metalli]GHF28593.1 hypothetical protein GCM10017781_00670 [Deinococcus metalli]